MVKRRTRAFFVADALVGLFIIATLAAALAVALGKQRKSITRLGDTREATHLAERALFDLQCGREPPRVAEDSSLDVRKLDDAPGWVEVTASVRGRSVSLIGLATLELRR